VARSRLFNFKYDPNFQNAGWGVPKLFCIRELKDSELLFVLCTKPYTEKRLRVIDFSHIFWSWRVLPVLLEHSHISDSQLRAQEMY
jgi:hypothetical protein